MSVAFAARKPAVFGDRQTCFQDACVGVVAAPADVDIFEGEYAEL